MLYFVINLEIFCIRIFLFPRLVSVKTSLARNMAIIDRYGQYGANGRTRRRNYHETNGD